MNQTLKNITIFSCSAIATVLMLWFFVQVPAMNEAYSETEAAFNSTNTCTELIFFDNNLDKNLSNSDYNHFENLIKQKSKELKCP